MIPKTNDFQSMFNEAEKTPAYQVERAALGFTEDLVALMERQGINRSELARRIGCSPAYITKILRGKTNFTLESMVRIANALGVRLQVHMQADDLDRPIQSICARPTTKGI